MNTMNKVFLMGHLGDDPKVQTSRTGMSYVRLNLATNRRMKPEEDKNAEQRADWHTVFVWGQHGETCAKYLRRGSAVFVEGFINTYCTKKNEGPNEWKSSIRALNVSFLGGGQHGLKSPEIDTTTEELDLAFADSEDMAVAH